MAEGLRRKDNKFVRQQYGQVGKHSVVKICGWTKKFIRYGKSCYKHHFYGISTGNCLEMSPILICNQRCKHCWRDHSLFSDKMNKVDEPEEIIDGCIAERKRLLMGFKGWEKVDLERFEECLVPKQAAISLTGEPCLYPKLPGLVSGFYSKGFDSVFLVTNGTVPAMLKKLGGLDKLPTNIYLSVEWWDKESYVDFCKPLDSKQYEKILESMDVLKRLKGKVKTVLRITCVKGFNMDNVKEFKWIVERMQPSYIECKGYMFVGQSRERMVKENMPDHSEVKEFASELASLSGYRVEGEQEESRVVLLE
jgi:tRNA wybutosine-synthesizing protein 1